MRKRLYTALKKRIAGWRKRMPRISPEGAKKAASVASTLILAAAIVLCVFVAVQVQTVGYVSIGGKSLFRVVTGSMEPTISTGALLVSRQTEINSIRVGDIICYRSENTATKGWVITHRVVGVIREDGETYLETKGDANTAVDSSYVTRENLIGRVSWYSKEGSSAAKAVSALSSRMGFMSLILFPCLLIAGIIMSRSVSSIRREIDNLKQEERKAEAQKETDPDPRLAAWGITPEEYAQMRERILRELMAERETMLQMLRLQLSKELQQGETHENREIHAAAGLETDRKPAEGTIDQT